MDEFDKLYTVEDIAKMTSLTSRTIRNYLKDGSLKGKKIGGQWRFTMDDIKNLFDNGSFAHEIRDAKKSQVLDFLEGVDTDITGDVQICAIADVYCTGEEAVGWYQSLVSVINNGENHFSYAKFNYDYIETEQKARFTLFGTPQFIVKTIALLQ
jgi:excisionase family DNA binding protein